MIEDEAIQPSVGPLNRSWFVPFASRLTIIVGLMVLAGWVFEVEALKVVLPGLVAMKVNTAIGFVLLGIALVLITAQPPTIWKLRLGQLAAVGVSLIGIVTTIEYCSGWNVGIDELFVADPADTSPYHGRPSPATILNFCLLGIALLLIRTKRRYGGWIVQGAVLSAFLLAMLALVGYAYGVVYGYRPPHDTYPLATMALHTAMCFTLICAGILYSRNDFRLIAPLRSNSTGGMLSRRMFPTVFGGSLFLGWLQLQGERQGYYGLEFGLAIYCTAMIVTFSMLVWWISHLLDRADFERKRAEVALGNKQAELAHVLRINTMGEMVAGIAHELNQPLSAILNFAQGTVHRLRSGDRETSELVEVAESIAAESTRAAEIVQSLRRYVTNCNPQRNVLDLNVIVHNVQQILAGEARQRGVTVTLQCDGLLPRVAVDRVQIVQVLINLICNGFDALESATEPKLVWVETRRAVGGAEVVVTDNGCGLPLENQQKIFDAFFTTKPRGMGMGLAISRTIIEAHQGKLWAAARRDGGTMFHFFLPTPAADFS